jgi:hypothetical protein
MSFQFWSVAGSGVEMDEGIGPFGRCGPGKLEKGLDECFQGEGCRAGTTPSALQLPGKLGPMGANSCKVTPLCLLTSATIRNSPVPSRS